MPMQDTVSLPAGGGVLYLVQSWTDRHEGQNPSAQGSWARWQGREQSSQSFRKHRAHVSSGHASKFPQYSQT